MPVEISKSTHLTESWHLSFDDDAMAELLRREIEANYPEIPRDCKMKVDITDMGVSVTFERSSYA